MKKLVLASVISLAIAFSGLAASAADAYWGGYGGGSGQRSCYSICGSFWN